MIQQVVGIYFSPSGRTSKITRRITSAIAESLADNVIDEITITYYDMLTNPPDDEVIFDEDTIAVIGVPSYTGRVPLPVIKLLKKFRGNGTMAVAFVAYGNTAYGDSLYEACTFIEEQGFLLLGAGAFPTQNSIFSGIATGRPDSEDFRKILKFAKQASNKIMKYTQSSVKYFKRLPAPLEIKGSLPSSEPLRIPLHPTINENCICCMKCAEICPVDAIDFEDPGKLNTSKCISCASCVHACEHDARGFFTPMSQISRLATYYLYLRRKEPEWFL